MLEGYKEILDTKELCEILRIDKKTAYQLLKDGAIISRRIGRVYRIPKEAVIFFLEK